jgi:hypothetical protein
MVDESAGGSFREQLFLQGVEHFYLYQAEYRLVWRVRFYASWKPSRFCFVRINRLGWCAFASG